MRLAGIVSRPFWAKPARQTIASRWRAIARLATNPDFIAICGVVAVGLAVSLWLHAMIQPPDGVWSTPADLMW